MRIRPLRHLGPSMGQGWGWGWIRGWLWYSRNEELARGSIPNKRTCGVMGIMIEDDLRSTLAVTSPLLSFQNCETRNSKSLLFVTSWRRAINVSEKGGYTCFIVCVTFRRSYISSLSILPSVLESEGFCTDEFVVGRFASKSLNLPPSTGVHL